MNVFISWSGERSRVVAEALRDWLPKVIQATKPWISFKDIEKGTRWSGEIAEQLEICNTGIVCLTKDNQHAPWLLFESGALSKSLDESFVWTYLLDLSPAEVKEPLAQFQHTEAKKQDTKELLKSINKALKDSELKEDVLEDAFETYWPQLDKKLNEAKATKIQGEPEPTRSERDMLEEILNTMRGVSREISTLSLGQTDWSNVLKSMGRLSLKPLGSIIDKDEESARRRMMLMAEALRGTQVPDEQEERDKMRNFLAQALRDADSSDENKG